MYNKLVYLCLHWFVGCVANFGGYTDGCYGWEQQVVGPQGATCNGTATRYTPANQSAEPKKKFNLSVKIIKLCIVLE